MKGLLLTAGVLMIAPLGSANAAVMTLGGPNSRLCYEAADGLDDRVSAVEGCTRSLNEEPLTVSDRAATYVNRGILHMIGGRYRAADADFSMAIATDSQLADAWLNKGFLALRENRGRDALAAIEKGMQNGARRQALALFARGLAHEQMGDLSAAYADLSRARELEPAWSLPGQYLARYQLRDR